MQAGALHGRSHSPRVTALLAQGVTRCAGNILQLDQKGIRSHEFKKVCNLPPGGLHGYIYIRLPCPTLPHLHTWGSRALHLPLSLFIHILRMFRKEAEGSFMYGLNQPGWILFQKVVIFCSALSHYFHHFSNKSIKSDTCFLNSFSTQVRIWNQI